MTENVRDLHPNMNEIRKALQRASQGDGDPPDNSGMERLAALEARLDTIIPTLATKGDIGEVRADIQKGIGETHRWMLGTVIGLFLGFGGLFLAMSNALKPSSGATQPPIIVNVPAPQTVPPAAPSEKR